MSAIVNEKNLLSFLSHYVNITMFDVDTTLVCPDSLRICNIDYLMVDFNHFGHRPLLWREQGRFDASFIIVLHTITGWVRDLVFAVPLLRKDDIIIAPSKYAKESFLKITQRCNVHIIPHCVDVRIIKKLTTNVRPDGQKKIITYMGRLTEEKGIAVLLRALPRITKAMKNAHLNVIGPLSGYKMHNKKSSSFFKLQRLADELNIAPYVTFKGMQLGETKYKMLAESCVFINPSLNVSETFSVTNIEAMACGIPVISTYYRSAGEIIKHGKNGFLINLTQGKHSRDVAVDTEQLAYLVAKLLLSTKLRKQLGQQARNDTLRFDYRVVIPNIIKLLKRKSLARRENRWSLLKDMRIADFRNFYTQEMLFFILFFGWGQVRYIDLCSNPSESIPAMTSLDNSMRPDLQKKWQGFIGQELFLYLST